MTIDVDQKRKALGFATFVWLMHDHHIAAYHAVGAYVFWGPLGMASDAQISSMGKDEELSFQPSPTYHIPYPYFTLGSIISSYQTI